MLLLLWQLYYLEYLKDQTLYLIHKIEIMFQLSIFKKELNIVLYQSVKKIIPCAYSSLFKLLWIRKHWYVVD